MREVTLIQAQTHGDFRRRDCSLRQATASVMLLLLSVAFPSSSAAVTFEENHEHVYDNAPEIKVRGSGFEMLIGSELEILLKTPRYPYFPSLDVKSDFFEWDISSDTVITLKLIGQQTRWPGDDIHNYTPLLDSSIKTDGVELLDLMWLGDNIHNSTPLLASSIKTDGVELLDKPLAIATLLPSPIIYPVNNVIYAESTPEFTIMGIFFNESSERNALFFDPPLHGALKLRTQQVPSSTHTSIIFAKGVDQWAVEPGPLTLVGIDNGHGRLHVDSQGITHASIPKDCGVVVADIQAELGKTSITVEPQGTLIIYQSTKRINVSGTGFKPGMKLRFGGYNCGGEANFNIIDLQPEKFTLELTEGSKWCKASQINRLHPARLVLLAADAGEGWVPLGPTMDKYGQTIAHVLEDPSIQPSFTQEVSSRMFHTQANHLVIKGTGFKSPFQPVDIALEFEPPLVEESEIRVTSRYSAVIKSGSYHWTTEGYVGPLSVKGMDGGAGMVVFEPPVQVATIVKRALKDFAVDGHITHQVVNATCSKLCLDLSWDAIVDGNNGICLCDNPKRPYNSQASLIRQKQPNSTCDICCHHQDEWDGYYYEGHSVCVCGSGNELSTVGADWFNEDGWHSISHNRNHPGGLKKVNATDGGTSKTRIWFKINTLHKPVFDDMALARRKKMSWDLTLFLGGSASCGVGVLLCTFFSRRIRSRRRA